MSWSRRLQLLLMGHGRHVLWIVMWILYVGRWMVVCFTLLFHSSSWTQARCNKEFWIGTIRPSCMPCLGRLAFCAYDLAGFVFEMGGYAKSTQPWS